MLRSCRHAAPRSVAAAGAALLAWACAAAPGAPPRAPTPRAAAPLPLVPRSRIDMAELTQATRRQSLSGNRTAMVWWLPEQFWDEALRSQKSPDAMIAATREVALDVAMSADGARLESRSEEALRASIRLRDAQGRAYPPLPWAEVNPGMTTLLGSIQPQLASMGKIGESFRAFVFPALDAEGKRIADPLAPLIAPRTCPIDSAQLAGTFRFCPFHGVERVNP